MDFIDNSVLPQSVHHLVLLKYLLVLTFIIFFTYTGILFGSTVLSLYFKRRADKSGDVRFKKFSKVLIDQITFNKGIAFALGITPMLSAMFCYVQLLHLSKSSIPFYIFISLIFFTAALILLYTYKHTFHLKEFFKHAEVKENEGEDTSGKQDFTEYADKTTKLNTKSGLYGIICLVISSYIFIGAVQLAGNTKNWESEYSFWVLLFSVQTITHYFQFIAASFAITSATFLYYNYKPEGSSIENSYSTYTKAFSLKLGLVSVIVMPLLIVLTVFVQPKESLSFGLFGLTAIALLLILLISFIYYLMIKEKNLGYRTWLLYLLVVVTVFLIMKDQYSFDTATKMHTEILAANYNAYEKKLNESFGVASAAINGAEIFNGRCVACHSFDHKIVGPPYKETLPKYEGKKADLVKFILNPVKINPNYPAMPNQGLKPNEAEAIADWIMVNYKK
jgi:cytochrome c